MILEYGLNILLFLKFDIDVLIKPSDFSLSGSKSLLTDDKYNVVLKQKHTVKVQTIFCQETKESIFTDESDGGCHENKIFNNSSFMCERILYIMGSKCFKNIADTYKHRRKRRRFKFNLLAAIYN